jgi:hypothetical protein
MRMRMRMEMEMFGEEVGGSHLMYLASWELWEGAVCWVVTASRRDNARTGSALATVLNLVAGVSSFI